MSGVPEILIEPEMSRRCQAALRVAARLTQRTLCLANCCSWTARPWRRRRDDPSERPELQSKQHGVMSHEVQNGVPWCNMVCHIAHSGASRLSFWPLPTVPVRAPLLQAVSRRCLTVAAPLLFAGASPWKHHFCRPSVAGASPWQHRYCSPGLHRGSTTSAGRQLPVFHRGRSDSIQDWPK